jgi:hypothetical protein
MRSATLLVRQHRLIFWEVSRDPEACLIADSELCCQLHMCEPEGLSHQTCTCLHELFLNGS